MELKNQLEFKFTGNSEPTFIAYQFAQENPNAIFLDEVVGWDEAENFVLETEQKLFGSGSYVVSSTVGERILEIRLNTRFATEIELRQFRQMIINQMISGGVIELAQKFYTQGEAQVRIETLEGHITALTQWEQTDLLCFIRFTVVCPTPEPTIITVSSPV